MKRGMKKLRNVLKMIFALAFGNVTLREVA